MVYLYGLIKLCTCFLYPCTLTHNTLQYSASSAFSACSCIYANRCCLPTSSGVRRKKPPHPPIFDFLFVFVHFHCAVPYSLAQALSLARLSLTRRSARVKLLTLVDLPFWHGLSMCTAYLLVFLAVALPHLLLTPGLTLLRPNGMLLCNFFVPSLFSPFSLFIILPVVRFTVTIFIPHQYLYHINRKLVKRFPQFMFNDRME